MEKMMSHDDSIYETEERARRRFRPFIWVQTVDGAHSFLSAIAERQVKVLWLPKGFEHLPGAERLSIVQSQIRSHYQQAGGRYKGFGDILSYQFATTFDSSIVLDTNGIVIEEDGGRFLLPEVWLAFTS
jgi:hypothetical protein